MPTTLYKSAFRELKAKARTALHHQMQVPCYYYDPKTLIPYPLSIRVHTKWDAKGDVQGTSFRFAETREQTPYVIFLRSEFAAQKIEPKRQGVVMISAEEGYRLDNDDPKYLQTKTWYVTPLSQDDLARYHSPEDGTIAIGRIVLPFLGAAIPSLPPPEVSGLAIQFQLATGNIVLPPVE